MRCLRFLQSVFWSHLACTSIFNLVPEYTHYVQLKQTTLGRGQRGRSSRGRLFVQRLLVFSKRLHAFLLFVLLNEQTEQRICDHVIWKGVIKLLTIIRGRALLSIHIPSITLIKGVAVAKGLFRVVGKEKKGSGGQVNVWTSPWHKVTCHGFFCWQRN